MKLVKPQTYLVGHSVVYWPGMEDFLRETENLGFLTTMEEARNVGVSEAEMLASFYAKLCYKSLTEGKNPGVEKVRPIKANLQGCFQQGHGSVFEHSWFNFVTTGTSRIETHEHVRHRVGVAYSQESGRFCRPVDGQIEFVATELFNADDPLFEEVRSIIMDIGGQIEYAYQSLEALMGDRLKSPETKKLFTSFLRRILPNGMANILGWSANVRQLRHMIVMRTASHAEEEIRQVFSQVWDLLLAHSPTSLYGLEARPVTGSAFPEIIEVL